MKSKIFILFFLLMFGNNAVSLANDCGSLQNHYGPYDYTNPKHVRYRLPIVEMAHFTSRVENLIGGQSGSLLRDLNYTLRTFPNHHRALYALVRYQLKTKKRLITRTDGPAVLYSVDCYFDRAIRFKHDDGKVRLLYGIYLHKTNQPKEALEQYKAAIKYLPSSAEAHYNIGLLYLEQGDIENSLLHAKKAYKLGFPLAGLKNKLIEKGVWKKKNADIPEKKPTAQKNNQGSAD